jgi:thiol-disulfide isomerase/thioredoxin
VRIRIALAAALVLSLSPLFSQNLIEKRAWYANEFEKLGFTVFAQPKEVGDFSAQALSGSKVSLGQLRGKVVILNFWATWCPPCRAEMPALDALWKKDKDKAFTIMGISVGEDERTVKEFIAKEGYGYPIFLDSSGELGSRFGARSIPTTYVLNKAGKAIAGKVGGAEYDSAEAASFFAQLASR